MTPFDDELDVEAGATQSEGDGPVESAGVLEDGDDRAKHQRPVCKGTRKHGGPCQSTLTGADGFCVQHSPNRSYDPRETGRLGGLKSGVTKRERRKTARDILRDRVEKNADKIWDAYVGAVEAKTPDGLPDHRARYQAASALLAEAYGKPLQPVKSESVTWASYRVEVVALPGNGKTKYELATIEGSKFGQPGRMLELEGELVEEED